MSIPSWVDAPGWANWLAQDKDGDWYWFEFEPEPLESFWLCGGSLAKRARKTPNYEPWKLTLRQRPEDRA